MEPSPERPADMPAAWHPYLVANPFVRRGWRFVWAPSREELESRFPELDVLDEWPEVCDPWEQQEIAREPPLRVGQSPVPGYFSIVLQERFKHHHGASDLYAKAWGTDVWLPEFETHGERDGSVRFLACYDYGMGGLWSYIWAPSAQELLRAYPELTILEYPTPGPHCPPVEHDFSDDDMLDPEPGGLLDLLRKERAKRESTA